MSNVCNQSNAPSEGYFGTAKDADTPQVREALHARFAELRRHRLKDGAFITQPLDQQARELEMNVIEQLLGGSTTDLFDEAAIDRARHAYGRSHGEWLAWLHGQPAEPADFNGFAPSLKELIRISRRH